MTLTGHIQNGVVVLPGGPPLPEGTVVHVTVPDQPVPADGHRLKFPLIRSGRAGTLDLGSDRIAEILMEEDLALAGR